MIELSNIIRDARRAPGRSRHLVRQACGLGSLSPTDRSPASPQCARTALDQNQDRLKCRADKILKMGYRALFKPKSSAALSGK